MRAAPLDLLDYVAMGRVDKSRIRDVIRGSADGCVENGCELSGGETAEMPGTYKDGDYDVAATIVGVVGRDGVVVLSQTGAIDEGSLDAAIARAARR